MATFLYLTGWTAQMATYTGVEPKIYNVSPSWYDAQVAAGVSHGEKETIKKSGRLHSLYCCHQVFGLFNNVVYAIGTYFVYLEWRANPAPGAATSPMPPA